MSKKTIISEDRRSTVIDWEKHSNATTAFIAGLIFGLIMGAFCMWAMMHRTNHLAKLNPACMVKMEKECR